MGVTFMKFSKNLDWTVAAISYQIVVGGIFEPPVCKYNPVEPLAKLPYEQIFLAVFWRAIDGRGATPGGIM